MGRWCTGRLSPLRLAAELAEVASIGLQADNPAGVLDSGSNLSTLVLRLYDGTAPQHH